MKLLSKQQRDFLGELLKDLRHLWDCRRADLESPVDREINFIGWMAGTLYRNDARGTKGKFFGTLPEFAIHFDGLSAWAARRLIGAMVAIRDRWDREIPRGRVATPRHLVSAIWRAAKGQGMEDDAIREMVHGATSGETASTRNLRRFEALKILERLQRPRARVIPIGSRGNKEARK